MSDAEKFGSGFSGTTRGALWMSTAVVLFSMMTILIRMVVDTIPSYEIIFVRGMVSMAILAPWLIRQGIGALATRRLPLMLSRGALTSIGLVTWIYALARLPLAEVVALHFTLPLFGVILAVIFLREKIDSHRWAATATGFIGMLVILRPGVAAVDPVAFIVLFSALAYAGTGVVTKVLVKTESSAAIVFYVSAFTALAFAVPCALDWVAPTPMQWLMLLGVALLNVLGQSFLNRSFVAADASFVMPFDFLRLPIAAIAGVFLFSEHPDIWTFAGAAIIFAATYYPTWRARKGKS
jgi:drug/metabolite transporter (DMT)-like permease